MRFLIAGINGQDGSYLAENILTTYPNAEILGVSYHENIRHELNGTNISYIKANLLNRKELVEVLYNTKPDYIYYAAAHTGSSESGFQNNLYENLILNYTNVAHILEYIAKTCHGQLIYLSSGRVFEGTGIINEKSLKYGRDLYSIFKIQAEELINFYRLKYNTKSNIFWLFNHESTRRKDDYFSSKILRLLYDLNTKNSSEILINSIDFYNNWGHANEYMKIILKLSIDNPNEDFIIADEIQILARELFQNIFEESGHDIKKYIENTSKHELKKLEISTKKMQQFLKYKPVLVGKDLFKLLYKEKYGESLWD